MSEQKELSELATVAVSFLLLAGLTWPFVTAVERVWDEEGLIYQTTALFGVPFDGNLDVPVLIVCGVLAGWLLLFCLDGTKRIQAVFVVVGVGVPFVLFVGETGRIAEAIARTPLAFVAGFPIGVVSAAAPSMRFYGTKRPPELSLRKKFRWLQFPAAAGAFLYGIAAIVLVAVIDHLVTIPRLVDGLVVAVSGTVLIVSLSVFMQYDKRLMSVVVSPPDFDGDEKYQPYVVGGLYETATNDHHGFPIEGDGELNAAQTARDMRDLDTRFESAVTFGYVASMFRGIGLIPEWVRQNWFLRTVVIESEGWTTNQIDDVDAREGVLPDPLNDAARLVSNYLVMAVPLVVRWSLQGTYGSVQEQIKAADTVLLIGPTPTGDEELPEGTDTLVELCERYADRAGTDVVLATTRAGPVAEEEGLSIDSSVFKQTIAVQRIGMDAETYRQCEIVPVDRFTRDCRRGFEDLLNAISK